MGRQTSPKFGFTLIEIIVVMAIIGVLASAGFPSLMLFAQEMRVETEARALVADLELLRSATMVAASGTGRIVFTHSTIPYDKVPPSTQTNYPIVSYRLADPERLLSRYALAPDTTRDLSSESVCIVTELSSKLATDTGCATCTVIEFDRTGALVSPATDTVLYLNFFRSTPTTPPNPYDFTVATYPGIGSWCVRIEANTGRIWASATGSTRCY